MADPADRSRPIRTGRWEPDRTRACVDASTVVVVRDGTPPQVFLLSRALDSDFAGGAWVFPGGKVDPRDLTIDDARWTGHGIARTGRRLGAPREALAVGLHVAAVRETFEEAGVLLAHREDGSPVRAEELASEGFRETRDALNERGVDHDWRPWLEAERLVLDLDALSAFAHWVTPHGVHRRFDTRFFLAAAPPDQLEVATADQVETTAGRWVSPSEALAAEAAGEITMIFPTIHTLRRLAALETDPARWTDAAHADLRRILPGVTRAADGHLTVHHPDGTDATEL